MKFEGLIGGQIFLFLRTPIWQQRSLDAGEVSDGLSSGVGGELAGVEQWGIWIESDALGAQFNEKLWAAQLRDGGPDAVGTVSTVYFVPFSEIRYAIGFREKEQRD